ARRRLPAGARRRAILRAVSRPPAARLATLPPKSARLRGTGRKIMRSSGIVSLAALAVALAACGEQGADSGAPTQAAETAAEAPAEPEAPRFAAVDQARIEAADPTQWPTYGGTF